ncbi:MAG: DUF1330 domain-containing protein [Alphaproteobacteria bacterium]
MAAYLIAQVTVTDPDRFADYRAAVPAVIANYGGRYIIRGGDVEAFEGSHDGRRLVIVEFPSLGRARAFWQSPEYREVRRLREGAAIMDVVAVEGA